MWKEPQLEGRRWVRCQSRAFFVSAAVFSFARGWFPGSGSSPASDFPMPGAALDRLRADGTVETIYANYGIPLLPAR